jgi:hypothetical protein
MLVRLPSYLSFLLQLRKHQPEKDQQSGWKVTSMANMADSPFPCLEMKTTLPSAQPPRVVLSPFHSLLTPQQWWRPERSHLSQGRASEGSAEYRVEFTGRRDPILSLLNSGAGKGQLGTYSGSD